MWSCCSTTPTNFNPRSREGSDVLAFPFVIKLSQFQSTLPRRERRTRTCNICTKVDFNPRSREGSDCGCSPTKSPACISIHAPAKGATPKISGFRNLYCISIHAPAKGATVQTSSAAADGIVFQSTLPRRERLVVLVVTVSVFPDFNPRSREGSDNNGLTYLQTEDKFQSTLPRRERHGRGAISRMAQSISIHAPAKGATPVTVDSFDITVHFNPRSREGSDQVRN